MFVQVVVEFLGLAVGDDRGLAEICRGSIVLGKMANFMNGGAHLIVLAPQLFQLYSMKGSHQNLNLPEKPGGFAAEAM